MNEMLKTLCMKNGLSGDETDVREYIKEIISPYCKEVITDNLGNLIAYKEGKKTPDSVGIGSFCVLMRDQASLLLASSVSWVKAALSLTAISASILRLISTPAVFRPCIKVE